MKKVLTRQKYKCDFCKRRSTKTAMENHEKICFRNPNRVCPTCKNDPRGVLVMNGEDYGGSDYYEPCYFCSQRDSEKEKKIDEYYKSREPQLKDAADTLKEFPF